jgi:nucleoside-diphosphate-sugar epimerase
VNILITGATGFVGRALLHRLCETPENRVVALSRRSVKDAPSNSEIVISTGFSLPEEERSLLSEVDVVVHCGARAHQMHDDPHTCLEEYRRVNVVETMKLARQAADANIKRFVYISSIKVNGELTGQGKLFTAEDIPDPVDPYGISKMEAEIELQRFTASTQMELVIVRPVLVYGPGVKANFLTLINWVNKGIPLPFASVCNKRSFVYLDNLIEFIRLCMVHRAAANEIFLISDGDDLSTPCLVSKIARSLGRRPFLIPVPVWLMSFCASVVGKSAITTRLFSSLQVDVKKNSMLLNWKAPYSVEQGIENTVKYYVETNRL